MLKRKNKTGTTELRTSYYCIAELKESWAIVILGYQKKRKSERERERKYIINS